MLAGLRKTWDKYTKGWMGSVIYLVLGFIVAYLLNTGLAVALKTDTPVVAVFSESLEPTYYKGDMIVVYGDKNVKVGDIIVFDVPDRRYPIIHRVYNITDQGINTKGDNNKAVDPWITQKTSLHGKAILKVPLLGWVKILFTQITGIG